MCGSLFIYYETSNGLVTLPEYSHHFSIIDSFSPFLILSTTWEMKDVTVFVQTLNTSYFIPILFFHYSLLLSDYKPLKKLFVIFILSSTQAHCLDIEDDHWRMLMEGKQWGNKGRWHFVRSYNSPITVIYYPSRSLWSVVEKQPLLPP